MQVTKKKTAAIVQMLGKPISESVSFIHHGTDFVRVWVVSSRESVPTTLTVGKRKDAPQRICTRAETI